MVDRRGEGLGEASAGDVGLREVDIGHGGAHGLGGGGRGGGQIAGEDARRGGGLREELSLRTRSVGDRGDLPFYVEQTRGERLGERGGQRSDGAHMQFDRGALLGEDLGFTRGQAADEVAEVASASGRGRVDETEGDVGA